MFREIPNFNNYLVNERGTVINKRTKKRLKQNDNGSGYLQVQFADGRNRYVHRLVAMAFIPCDGRRELVDHIDGNKKNNHVDNLRWVTAAENYQAYGYAERRTALQKRVIAENVRTGEVIEFPSRNACAAYFRCDKSKIKYCWLYKKGRKQNWVLKPDNYWLKR